jgi:diacylglycerol kinase family enzyme
VALHASSLAGTGNLLAADLGLTADVATAMEVVLQGVDTR